MNNYTHKILCDNCDKILAYSQIPQTSIQMCTYCMNFKDFKKIEKPLLPIKIQTPHFPPQHKIENNPFVPQNVLDPFQMQHKFENFPFQQQHKLNQLQFQEKFENFPTKK